jgi:hypothetical protein
MSEELSESQISHGKFREIPKSEYTDLIKEIKEANLLKKDPGRIR